MSAKKIIFITGTGTGVGKTLLTALLLHHLRQGKGRTLAMKPFCSGGLGDVRLLQSLQRGELSDREMNPFYFKQPVAPLVAAAKKCRNISLNEVLKRINEVENKCDCLLIEGSGGVLVPLGRGYTVADLIAELDCNVIVAAHNQLGTINHTLLTINMLRSMGIAPERLSVVMMCGQKTDHSSPTNQNVIAAMLKPIPVLKIPYLGPKAATFNAVKRNAVKWEKILTDLIPRL